MTGNRLQVDRPRFRSRRGPDTGNVADRAYALRPGAGAPLRRGRLVKTARRDPGSAAVGRSRAAFAAVTTHSGVSLSSLPQL